ncbi:hypothetical protein [uncultured Draconibacterium sp.]
MKWGIIDAYQKPKNSFNFVQKAYQPLLVNFQFTKRRWHNDEPFVGNIWVVNDLYEAYENLEIRFEIKDDGGKVLSNKNFAVKKVEENSAKLFFEIEEDVLSSVNKKFFVTLEMTDKDGRTVSANDYFFLIGDQAEATKYYNNWKQERIEQENKHGRYGSYYHFYKEFTGQDGAKYESDIQVPRAIGFE